MRWNLGGLSGEMRSIVAWSVSAAGIIINKKYPSSSSSICRYPPQSGGIRSSSNRQAVVELFPPPPPPSPAFVREARLEDFWQVAETHSTSFFPNYSFPLDFALRIDRFIGFLLPTFLPNGCRRTCLVALLTNPPHSLAGILTLDTLAHFLPRKGPLRHRRSGIAYVSNVAVRKRDRCKGIAKRLMIKAEAHARSWNCRAIALHCDLNNPAAMQLYKGQGFKCIKVPDRANWPQPKTSSNVQFSFMMKLLTSHNSS